MSSMPRWENKSLWLHDLNEAYGGFGALPETQQKMNEPIKGEETGMEKIAVLVHWVADDIRYTSTSIGEGEGFTLRGTKMNYTDRYDVCKGIAGTLISSLRTAGFEAYPTMIMTGSRIESIPADHFNRYVAVVKLANGMCIPFDPT